jgi:membrane protease subunit HflK
MTMRYLLYIAVLVLLASLLTGVTQVQLGERAVVYRFGRVLEDKPRPGLWIGLPWGMDRVERVPVDLVQRVTVGYNPNEEEKDGIIPAGQFLTGDHNLVNIQVMIDFSVEEDEVARYVVQKDRVDGLVARAAESALAEWAASRSVDEILLNGKAVLPRVLIEQTQGRIADYELGVRLQDASVALILPPEQVRKAFEEVNQAQTMIQTSRFKAEQERSEGLGKAETERDRILKEAEAFVQEQRNLAQTDAENFLKRVREYRRFKNKNPDYLHDIWFQEIKKIFARLQERGGRVEPLDRFLGRDGVDIIRVPISERDRK